MTRDQAKELLPIIGAYSRGETIETRRPDGVWETVPTDFDMNFMCSPCSYRIKPKPREFWIVTTHKNLPPSVFFNHPTGTDFLECIHVKEVSP